MHRPIALLLLLSSGLWLPGSGNAADLERGRALAERWCGNCHVVDRTAAAGRADGLPTLPAIAAKRETTAASLKGVLSAPHGRMPDLSLGARDQDDLIAYILSLRPN
jgi:mono/diheme cytochrome c family protein